MRQLGLHNLILLGLFGVILVLAVVLFLVPTPAPVVEAPTAASEPAVTAESCVADECLAFDSVATELPENVVDALVRAYLDEQKAFATYEAVIERFGVVRPFSNIRRAEERHAASLAALFEKYGVAFPDTFDIEPLAAELTLTEACTLGIAGEIENIRLYEEELLPIVAPYPDMTRVFTDLMEASRERHLPAFTRCAE